MADLRRIAVRAARRHGINPDVFLRQIRQESGFNPNARSPAGAVGVAQFMPATARQYGVNPRDPVAALDAAARYMADNLKRTGGNYRAALSIYNSGRPEGYKSIPETRAYVAKILGGGRTPTASAASSSASATRTIPGVDRSRERGALIAQFLNEKKADPVDLALGVRGLQDTPARTVTTGGGEAGTTDAGRLVSRANAINAKRLPYAWGGGHGGRVNAYKAQPLDCSGAVSAVLGINPRVSGQFTSWGKPGEGGNVTIYANAHHVLMRIGNHFFGTSSSNPGGGAGWIPQSQISPEYLKGFTARHM